MMKRSMFALGVLVCVGVAYGAAVKIKEITPLPPESAQADGMAILNHVHGQDETIVQIVLSDFTSHTTYDFQLVSPNGVTKLQAHDVIETDEHGHGTFHGALAGDVSGFDLEIYLDEDNSQLEPDELRAVGWNPN